MNYIVKGKSSFYIYSKLLFAHLRNKPSLTMETSADLFENSTLENVKTTTDLQGVTNVFSAQIILRGNVRSKSGQYVCLTATEG